MIFFCHCAHTDTLKTTPTPPKEEPGKSLSLPRVHLTDVAVKALKAPEKGQLTYWDKSTPGFGVRVSVGGAKSFVLMQGTNRRRTTIGRYPDVSLRDARDEARCLSVAKPNKLQLREMSFEDAKQRFLTDCKARVRPNTFTEYNRMLQNRFKFGSQPMSELSRGQIMNVIAKLRDTPGEQNHAFTVIRIFLNWAARYEIIDRNPLAGLPKPSPARTRDRFLNEEELRAVFHKSRTVPYPYGTIVQLLILMGQRRGETAQLQWDWIDQSERLITFPAEITKNKRQQILPYGELTAAIFDNTPVLGGYVFASRNEDGTTFGGWSKCKRRFDIGLDFAPFTLHDLRRTYSSTHAMLGTPIHVTEKLLNHVSGTVSGVAAIYNRHSYIPEMRAAVERYEQYLSNLVKDW